MSELGANVKMETLLSKEMSLFKAAVIFIVVIFSTSAILYSIGKSYFWQSPQAQTPQERGLNYFQALVDKNPEKPENWVDLGWYHYQAGAFDKALESHLKALTINPDHFGALYNAGLTSLQVSDYAKAVGYLEKATTINPQSWESHLALGVAFMGLEDWIKAETAMAAALDINRHSADTHFYMGYLSEKIGNKADAREYYQESLRYNPDFLPASEGLARVSDTK